MFSYGMGTHRNTSIYRKFLPSFPSFMIFIFLIISLLMNGGLQPHKRGFFCNDPTIQYPHKPDTCSFKLLLIIALVIPAIVIKLIEIKLARLIDDCSSRPRSKSTECSDDRSKELAEGQSLMETPEKVKRRLVINDDDSDLEVCDSDTNPIENCDKSNNGGANDRPISDDPNSFESDNRDYSQDEIVRQDLVKFRMTMRQSIGKRKLSNVHIFLFGFTTTGFLTGIGKMTCGRLRPHFMQRCMPDIDCTLLFNTNRYIENFECTNKLLRPRDFSYITSSWPSGHAAIMFYSMLYLIFYLNSVIPAINKLKAFKKGPNSHNLLLAHSIYVLMTGLATYISLTRVSDYHHHPLDVLSGTVIGIVVAIVLAKCVFVPPLKATRPLTR